MTRTLGKPEEDVRPAVVEAFHAGYEFGYGDGQNAVLVRFLRAIRLGLGLDLTAAARRIGISRQTLARLERGEQRFDRILRERVVQAYGAAVPEDPRAVE